MMAIYVDSTKIANLLTTGFQRTKETRETTNKDTAGSKTFKYKRGSATINGSAHIDFAAGYGIDDLFEAMDNETELTVLLSTDVSGDSTYGGTALLTDLSADYPDDENSTYSFTMLVSGGLTKSAVA
ncbi:MAG: hypothetical protein JRJ57_00200 [Deltaproteobacteria bacterium]|nr:hypothetical protein [Deltaproteobacteria bacterium]